MNIPKLPTSGGAPPPPAFLDQEASELLLQNTMIIYGPTGSRKTSQLRAFAKYIYEKTGKKTRLISMDGGGWGTAQDVVDAGILEPWRLVEEDRPRPALVKASRGAWPERLIKGHRSGANLIEYLPENRAKALKDVGAYVIESLYSIASGIMRDDVRKGRKTSEDVVGLWKEGVTDEPSNQESFGAPARSHYGAAQSFMLDLIRNFSGLPLESVLYTSLEGKGVDKMDGVTYYGPLVAGSALTATIPAFVGDCLHFEDFRVEAGTDPLNPKQKLIEEGVRAWFTKHPDTQTGMLWPAKARIIPSQIKEFREKMGKNGYFILGDDSEPDLGTYLRLEDEMLSRGIDKQLAWKKMIDEKRSQG